MYLILQHGHIYISLCLLKSKGLLGVDLTWMIKPSGLYHSTIETSMSMHSTQQKKTVYNCWVSNRLNDKNSTTIIKSMVCKLDDR